MANDERGNRNVPVAEVNEPHFANLRTTKEWHANARLIAAAPELLEAAKCFVSVYELMTDAARSDLPNSVVNVVGLFEAAIAKAEGQPSEPVTT